MTIQTGNHQAPTQKPQSRAHQLLQARKTNPNLSTSLAQKEARTQIQITKIQSAINTLIEASKIAATNKGFSIQENFKDGKLLSLTFSKPGNPTYSLPCYTNQTSPITLKHQKRNCDLINSFMQT